MNTYTDRPLVVQQLFDTNTHNTLLRYVNEFVPMFPLAADRKQSDGYSKFGRRYAHNLPLLVQMHRQLTDYASELFGEKVKPSYVFLSMYDKGGRCPLHIDRPQCRYTIDYLVQQEKPEPWSISIGKQMSDEERNSVEDSHPQTNEVVEKVIASQDWTDCLLKPNDAVCYSGTNAWHYRKDASLGTADLIFFHFVPEKFNGPLN